VNLTGQDFATFMDPSDPTRHDIFKMMVVGFSHWAVSGFYIVAIALLSLHLSHGVSAMFQSIGWKNKVYGPVLDRLARVAAVAIFLGYISIPIAVLAGFGKDYVDKTRTTPVIVEEAKK
jgi:succinate dehydrogenase / fumarate reductase cytochrome b subunit